MMRLTMSSSTYMFDTPKKKVKYHMEKLNKFDKEMGILYYKIYDY